MLPLSELNTVACTDAAQRQPSTQPSTPENRGTDTASMKRTRHRAHVVSKNHNEAGFCSQQAQQVVGNKGTHAAAVPRGAAGGMVAVLVICS
jgi:hypothetical protein